MKKIIVVVMMLFAVSAYASNIVPQAEWYCYFSNSGGQATSAAMGFDKVNRSIKIIASNESDTRIIHYYQYQVEQIGTSDIYHLTAPSDFSAFYNKTADEITVSSPAGLQQRYLATACDY